MVGNSFPKHGLLCCIEFLNILTEKKHKLNALTNIMKNVSVAVAQRCAFMLLGLVLEGGLKGRLFFFGCTLKLIQKLDRSC